MSVMASRIRATIVSRKSLPLTEADLDVVDRLKTDGNYRNALARLNGHDPADFDDVSESVLLHALFQAGAAACVRLSRISDTSNWPSSTTSLSISARREGAYPPGPTSSEPASGPDLSRPTAWLSHPPLLPRGVEQQQEPRSGKRSRGPLHHNRETPARQHRSGAQGRAARRLDRVRRHLRVIRRRDSRRPRGAEPSDHEAG